MTMNSKEYILARLGEPSTWAGVSALAVAVGVPLDVVTVAVKVVIAISGIAAIFLKEGK